MIKKRKVTENTFLLEYTSPLLLQEMKPTDLEDMMIFQQHIHFLPLEAKECKISNELEYQPIKHDTDTEIQHILLQREYHFCHSFLLSLPLHLFYSL